MLWVVVSRVLERAPRPDVFYGLLCTSARVYLRLFHRLRVSGHEHLPDRIGPEGLIVIANHVSGLDPIAIQCVCRFEIRWMMLREMMLPTFDALWSWLEVIPVSTADSQAARTALKHVKSGGVLGIFPQGAIERPWKGGRVEFQPGVGLIVSRTGAPVLICRLDSVPRCSTAWGSLFRPAPSPGLRLRILGVVRYADAGLDAAQIVADLERRIRSAEATIPVPGEDTGAPTAHDKGPS